MAEWSEAELRRLEQAVRSAGGEVQKWQDEVSRLEQPLPWHARLHPLAFLDKYFGYHTVGTPSEKAEAREQYKQALVNYYRSVWRRDIYSQMPSLVISGPNRAAIVTDVSDLLKYIPAVGFDLSEEDKKFAERVIAAAQASFVAKPAKPEVLEPLYERPVPCQ